MLQLVPSSRFSKQPELIAPYKVTTPLWPAHTIVINPKKPRTEEANGTEAAPGWPISSHAAPTTLTKGWMYLLPLGSHEPWRNLTSDGGVVADPPSW
jgi:hypothetical protein